MTTRTAAPYENNSWQHQLVEAWRENHSEEQVKTMVQEEIDALLAKIEKRKQQEEAEAEGEEQQK